MKYFNKKNGFSLLELLRVEEASSDESTSILAEREEIDDHLKMLSKMEKIVIVFKVS